MNVRMQVSLSPIFATRIDLGTLSGPAVVVRLANGTAIPVVDEPIRDRLAVCAANDAAARDGSIDPGMTTGLHNQSTVTTETLSDVAETVGVELVVVDATTDVGQFSKELR